MGAAAYNRGTRAIRAQFDREAEERRRRSCGGVFANGPGKRFVRCCSCGAVDYERSEGDVHTGARRGS